MGQATRKPTDRQAESPPLWNEQAERALLAACLVDPASSIAPIRTMVGPEDFYSPAHQTIMAAILAIHSRGDGVDLVTVAAELGTSGALERIGGAAYLQSLLDSHPVVVHAEHYAQLVTEQAYRRRLDCAADALKASVRNGGDPAEMAQRIASVHKPNDAIDTMCRAILWHQELEDAQLPTVQPILGKGLLARGDYGILYGPKGSGKSWLALDLAARVSDGVDFCGWKTQQAPVLVWSLELTRERLRERLRAISPGRIHKHLAFFGKDSLTSIPGSAGLSPIPRLALQEDQARVLTVVKSIGPGLVVIDPLGPCVAVDENAELPAIARFLVDLSARANCAVLATHHPRKGDPKNPSDSIHEMRGASQLGDWACAAFVLKAEKGLFCLKCVVDPRHCATPDDVWLRRTDLGTFMQTDAPERDARARDMRGAELRQAFAEYGKLTSSQVTGLLGVSKPSATAYLKAAGATLHGNGRAAYWTLGIGNPENGFRLLSDSAEDEETE